MVLTLYFVPDYKTNRNVYMRGTNQNKKNVIFKYYNLIKKYNTEIYFYV